MCYRYILIIRNIEIKLIFNDRNSHNQILDKIIIKHVFVNKLK